ncbi:MAG: dihydrodipicolinate synthase family protein [SAR202 cluster bacterium]|nr:dihydrodipicolinate synthase family protein [SAR202 cluster bacterium]
MVQKRYPQGMLGACNTPWNEKYQLDEKVFERHLKATLALGYKDLYVMGTAGEGYAVNDAQFRNIVDVFVSVAKKPGVNPQVGVISLSMSAIIDRIKYGYDKGVRLFQLSLPSWGIVSDTEMMTFFKTVCGTYPDAKFLHYNLIRTKRVLTGDDYRKIADAVPNLVATKNSSYDMNAIRDMMVKAPEIQHFFVQNAFAYGATLGECSLLCSLGGVFPNLTKELFDTARTGNVKRSFEINNRMIEVAKGLLGHLKSPYVDGAYDKSLEALANPEFPRRLLPPYETISEADFAVMKKYYEEQCRDIS